MTQPLPTIYDYHGRFPLPNNVLDFAKIHSLCQNRLRLGSESMTPHSLSICPSTKAISNSDTDRISTFGGHNAWSMRSHFRTSRRMISMIRLIARIQLHVVLSRGLSVIGKAVEALSGMINWTTTSPVMSPGIYYRTLQSGSQSSVSREILH